MKAELHSPKNFTGFAFLVLLASLVSAVAHADASALITIPTQDPVTTESVELQGVLRSIAGPGGETTGVALFLMDDLNNTRNTAIEVDMKGLKDQEAARAFVTGFGEADKVVEVTGIYEYLDLGPMRPHFKALLAQSVRAD